MRQVTRIMSEMYRIIHRFLQATRHHHIIVCILFNLQSASGKHRKCPTLHLFPPSRPWVACFRSLRTLSCSRTRVCSSRLLPSIVLRQKISNNFIYKSGLSYFEQGLTCQVINIACVTSKITRKQPFRDLFVK